MSLRPEIEASKLNVEASELGIGIAKSSYLPTISLSAGIGTNHTSGSDSVSYTHLPKHYLSASYSYDVMSPMDKFLFTDKDNIFLSVKTRCV